LKSILSNCFLCNQHSLHVAGTEEAQVMQCISCGYVTSTKYIGTIETNEEVKKLSLDMKKWAVEKNGRVWIPSIMTLPIGMLYPSNKDNKMKWFFAPMVEIPEEDREKYPNGDGGFYERKIDTDNPVIYDEFIDGMAFINKKLKKGK
tara:strand:- start:300 stop:740 length:441 start_codon:yes stop_codon:yes gene_type:complete